MGELVVHYMTRSNRDRMYCGQIKMRDGERRTGLRYTAFHEDVTCRKCIAKLDSPV